jgi:putative heme degradation protein
MKCFGTCLFLKGLWADLSAENAPLHLRIDANNLVTTARTTHQPEQKETIHLIQMLRRESNSGVIDDLAHVVSKYCLSDALTKHSAKPDELVKVVEIGNIRCVDMHPPVRSLIKHKAYLVAWLADHVNPRSFSSREVQNQNKEAISMILDNLPFSWAKMSW